MVLIMVEEIDQYMKPHGKKGIEIIESMNEEHVYISEFAFECVNINEDDRILDIGCGGGINIAKFLKLAHEVDGIDYSEVSVSKSIEKNKIAVDEGRCKIIQANVSSIPFEDNSYDLVSAFSTIFFWPDLVESFKEVLRILKPDGQFMIAQGTDGTNPEDEELNDAEKGINIYTASEIEKHLKDAGFKSSEVVPSGDSHLLVVLAKK